METKRITIAAALLFVAVFVGAPLSRAADIADSPYWPEHHGPGRTNISADFTRRDRLKYALQRSAKTQGLSAQPRWG